LFVAWVPRTPQPPLGAGSQQLCSAFQVSVGCSLVLYLFGPPARFLTDTSGGGDPSPNLSFKIHPVSGPVAPIHSQPSGASGAQAPCILTLLCGGSLHCSFWSFLNHLSTHGGVGAWGMPPRTPPPPSSRTSGWGGGGPVNQGPLSFLIMCGVGPPDPPCPHWGAGSQQLCSASD